MPFTIDCKTKPTISSGVTAKKLPFSDLSEIAHKRLVTPPPTHTHTHTHIYIYRHTQTQTHTHTHTHARTHTHTHTDTHICSTQASLYKYYTFYLLQSTSTIVTKHRLSLAYHAVIISGILRPSLVCAKSVSGNVIHMSVLYSSLTLYHRR